MARITSYSADSEIIDADKIVGTDGNVGSQYGKTKNFTLGDIKQYVKEPYSYKVFTALLTQSGGDVSSTTIGDEYLLKGVTYTIVNLEPGDDLTPYGAPNNNVGTSFMCTQETTTWGSPSSTLSWNYGAPVATVLENTIGNIWFEYVNTGVYFIKSIGLFTDNKTWTNPTGLDNTQLQLSIYRINNNECYIVDQNGNGGLYNTSIEIRVYN